MDPDIFPFITSKFMYKYVFGSLGDEDLSDLLTNEFRINIWAKRNQGREMASSVCDLLEMVFKDISKFLDIDIFINSLDQNTYNESDLWVFMREFGVFRQQSACELQGSILLTRVFNGVVRSIS